MYINILLYNVHKIELSKLPTRPHDTVLVRFSWALSYVIHVIFMMYYTVMFFVGRLGWQIIRAIIASVITPALFHESRQMLSRDADYDSPPGDCQYKKAFGKRLTSVGQVLA